MRTLQLKIILPVVMLLNLGSWTGLGQEPARPPWIMSGERMGGERVASIRPEVHTVRRVGDQIEVRSAGLSLHYLGPFQTPVDPVERQRRHRFRIPANPVLNGGDPVPVRPEVVGLFVNGVPIYQQNGQRSYRGQNIWHFDQLALNDDGRFVATGRPRAELTHTTAPGLLEALIAGDGSHSPIIGFALDGYPIYGPWGLADSGGGGQVRRLRSGYRLRSMTLRDRLPDGTRLTPGQHGPPVSAEFPPGSFIEDYVFEPGAGDLDRFNGRWTITPDYPAGTYAYFMTTDEAGRLAFPYLLAGHYRGSLTLRQLQEAWRDETMEEVEQGEREIESITPQQGFRMRLRLREGEVTTTSLTRFSFEVRSPAGGSIRHLENVHERPIHLLIVSEDLGVFHHLHPELAAGDRYEVYHRFTRKGRYRLYADYTPPGGGQQIVSYLVDVKGEDRRLAGRATGSVPVEPRWDGIDLQLAPVGQLRAGEEIEFRLRVRDRAGRMIAGLEPFLGAWAHFVVINQGHRHFIHAHPFESGMPREAASPGHSHLPFDPGPPPEEIRTMIIFPDPGLYRIWAQFQVTGEVMTVPFDFRIGSRRVVTQRRSDRRARPDQVGSLAAIRVGGRGFSPAEVMVPSGQPLRLAIERAAEPNCASEIVIPALGIRRRLPLGETTILELPPLEDDRISFSCGMGMYKGVLIVLPATPKREEENER